MLFYLLVCGSLWVHHSVHVEVREQLGGVNSLPIPCGTQGGAQSQAIRLGSKLLLPLSHHVDPSLPRKVAKTHNHPKNNLKSLTKK